MSRHLPLTTMLFDYDYESFDPQQELYQNMLRQRLNSSNAQGNINPGAAIATGLFGNDDLFDDFS